MSTPPPYPPEQNPQGQNSYPGNPGPAYPGAQQPQQGYPGQAAYPPPRTPRPKGPATLGVIAAIAAIVGTVAGAVIVGISGTMLGDFISTESQKAMEDTSYVLEDSSFVGYMMGIGLGFGLYGLLGLWGLIQGIIATVLNRGRGWGIAAIVISVLGVIPVIIVYATTFLTALDPSMMTS